MFAGKIFALLGWEERAEQNFDLAVKGRAVVVACCIGRRIIPPDPTESPRNILQGRGESRQWQRVPVRPIVRRGFRDDNSTLLRAVIRAEGATMLQ